MQNHQIESVLSADGTSIGYRKLGHGPGLILLHGALQTSNGLAMLSLALSDSFTVFAPDRRGRGFSGPIGQNYGMSREVEDVAALISKTGASRIFGLSSGALIALQAGFALPRIEKVAAYEPPLEIPGAPSPLAWVPLYERRLARGKVAGAMVAGMKGTGEKSLLTRLPDFILIPLMRLALRKDAKRRKKKCTTLETLVRLVHFDVVLAEEMAGTVEKYRTMRPEVLLMGGSQSADFLKAGLNHLEKILPHVRRVELAGAGHLAAIKEPNAVAAELKKFL